MSFGHLTGEARLAAFTLRAIKGCTSVLDVGSGPGKYLHQVPRAVRRIALDAFAPYLSAVDADEKLLGEAQKILPTLPTGYVDAVMALDFIEHLYKSEAETCIVEMKRIARRVVILFTPEGYVPQDKDVLGQGADHWQTHRSGFYAEDLRRFGFNIWHWYDFHAPGVHALFAVWSRIS